MGVDFKLIGKRIQTKRKLLDKTQEDLAEYLDVSVGYVSNMERGTTKISLTTLANISDFLGCDISELVSQTSTGGEDYMKSEFDEIIASFDKEEKNILLGLLQTYKSMTNKQ